MYVGDTVLMVFDGHYRGRHITEKEPPRISDGKDHSVKVRKISKAEMEKLWNKGK